MKHLLLRTTMMLLLMSMASVNLWADDEKPNIWNLDGFGTEEEPYIIKNGTDWDTFAALVNKGSGTFKDQYIKVEIPENAGNTVYCGSTMVGTSEENSFQGHFDGGGYILEFNATTSEDYCAPFRYVKNATFERVHVKGNIESSAQFAAGIASAVYGITSFKACRSSVTIKGTKNGDGTHGGLVALIRNYVIPDETAPGLSVVNFTDCLFDGTFNLYHTINGDRHICYGCASFVGFTDGNRVTLTNCYNHMQPANIQQDNNPDYEYEEDFKIYHSWDDNGLYVRKSTTTVYNQINCLTSSNFFDKDAETYNLQDQIAGRLGSGWALDVDDNGNAVPIVKAMNFNGSGTENNPYEIKYVTDWNKLVSNVNNYGQNYDDQYFKVTADFGEDPYDILGKVTTTLGTEANPFKGIFDGDGHTITVNIHDTYHEGTAPFRYISNATIKNLTLAGKVTGYNHTAGLVGFAWNGDNYIQDCVVSALVEGGDRIGGFVAHGKSSNLTFTDCEFSGTLRNGYAETDKFNLAYAGGILGWSDGSSLTMSNCVFGGTYQGTGNFHPIALRNENAVMTNTINSVMTTVAPAMHSGKEAYNAGAEGKMVYKTQDEVVSEEVKLYQLVNGKANKYYRPVTIKDMNKTYLYHAGYIENPNPYIMDAENLILEEKNYKITFSNAGDNIMGHQTLTIEGQAIAGDFVQLQGTQTFDYHVLPSGIELNESDNSYYVTLPSSEVKSLTIDEHISPLKIYDDGGKDGNYSQNCSGRLDIEMLRTYKAKLTGNVNTENSDIVTIKEGENVLSSLSGSQTITDAVKTIANKFSIQFKSGAQTAQGFELTMTQELSDGPYYILSTDITGGSIEYDSKEETPTYNVGETVTMTATPDEGYMLTGFTVTEYGDDEKVLVTKEVAWYSQTPQNTTFEMPRTDIAVNPSFTAYNDLSIKMPDEDVLFASIPTGITTFKIYDIYGIKQSSDENDEDDGIKEITGEDNTTPEVQDYKDYNGTLYLQVPTGYKIRITGKMTRVWNDNGVEEHYLQIFDGISKKDVDKLTDHINRSSYGIDVTSSQNLITLYFQSNTSFGHDLDLTVELVPTTELTLYNNQANSESINNHDGKEVKLEMKDRTIYCDGHWNSLCLPFDVDLNRSPFNADDMMVAITLDEVYYDSEECSLTLDFSDPVTYMVAGTPYLVQYSNPDEDKTTLQDFVNPSFTLVRIKKDLHPVTCDYVTFMGNYDPVEFTQTDLTVLYLGDDDTLYYPNAPMTIGAFRAYFKLDGLTAEELNNARNIVLDFGDGETTSLPFGPVVERTDVDNQWYTLDGRRLQTKPTQPGVYINNQKKVVLK